MGLLLPLFLLLASPAEVAAAPSRLPLEAVEVFTCNFDAAWDANFDGWPNDWSRKRGLGYPHYVDMRIADEGPPSGGRSLRVRLDGGAAAASSPPIAIHSLFEYVLEVQIRCEKLHHDRAFVRFSLLDAQHRVLRVVTSEVLRHTTGWQTVRMGPMSVDRNARFGSVSLHVEPDGLEDLTGTIWFGGVVLARMPHMALETNEPHQLFVMPADVNVSCIVSGAFAAPPEIHFQLEDAHGRVLDEAVKRPVLEPVDASTLPISTPAIEGSLGQGVAQWAPNVPGSGWYRLRAQLRSGEEVALEQRLALAVVDPAVSPSRGEFGWSLPRGDQPLRLPALARLLSQSGVRWAKFPLWLDEDESDERVQHLSAFIERLNSQGVDVVGLLGTPPYSLQHRFGASTVPAAEVFACDPSVWYPSIETTLTRMAMQVRFWQLGNDRDMSFLGVSHLADRVGEIKAQMDRIAQDADLGFAWDWTHALPVAPRGPNPWRFLSLTADPPLGAGELGWYLSQPGGGDVRRCLMLQPLARDDYPLETRIVDLVDRMVAAKMHDATMIVASDPFDHQTGLLHPDGTPAELFLPWRTTALMLGGSKYLGSLTLPGRSRNEVFARDGETIVVVRSDRSTHEPLSASQHITQTDLWGHATTTAGDEQPTRVPVGRMPTFITGMSESAAQWQLQLQLEQERIPSTFDRSHTNALRLINPFPRGVHGRVTIVAPDDWRIEPRQANFNLAAGEAWRQPFDLRLPNTAGSGRHLLRFDFELQADRPLKLSVYRYLDVGLGDVYIELTTQLDEERRLEVVQRFVNETAETVSFRCELFVPGRRSLKTQIVDLGRGHDVKVYRLNDGEELLGQPLWLRAQEIGGVRVLNYRLKAVK
jgi:hypothetical protein